MKRASVLILALLALASVTACAKKVPPSLQPSAPVPGAVLWTEPADLATRDLFNGPWGASDAPDPDDTFTLVSTRYSGSNLRMTVTDSQNREWLVKTPYPGGLDSEAPVDVVVSRLLSAVGYPQPATYYLPDFTLKDDFGSRTVLGGCFWLNDPSLTDEGEWQWEENPFIGTTPYKGLQVILMMLNNTDLRNRNNTVYQRRMDGRVERWYVVRDAGSALGDFDRWVPRTNHVASFEKAPFIKGVKDGYVDFAYKGAFRPFVEGRITPADVAWASNLLGRLSDGQWTDAFRAAAYDRAVAARFIARLKAKIAEGRALGNAATRQ